MMVQKGGQVTKSIIVVKIPCKLLYVIQVKGLLIKCSTSWPYLISEFLVAYSYRLWLLIGLALFYSQAGISLLFCKYSIILNKS